MYGMALIYAAYYLVTKPLTGYPSLAAFAESRYHGLEPFFYLTRGLSAVMGTLTVWWVYAICREILDETVGVVAALFLTLSFLHVRDSHFGVTDVTMSALIVLAVLLIIRWQRRGNMSGAAIAGVVGGLAMSTKYNGLGVCFPFAIAVVERLTRSRHAFQTELGASARATAVFAGAFVAAFLAGSPYVLIERQRFLNDVTVQGLTTLAGHGIATSRGWLQYAQITLPAAVGWPIYLAGVAGAVGLAATRLRQSAVLLAFPVAYYIVAGAGYAVFARHMIPVLPFLCISAAWLVVIAVRTVTRARAPRVRHAAIAVVALLAAAPSARQVVLLDRLLSRADNRVVVARALATLIPRGSLVFHSGGRYGHVPFDLPNEQLVVNECGYDERTGRFTPGDRLPDWIILQRSPLTTYSHVPVGLERIVRESYDLVNAFGTGALSAARVYDQQDAFFLPLSGLDGIKRPGPEFEIYRQRR